MSSLLFGLVAVLVVIGGAVIGMLTGIGLAELCLRWRGRK